MADSNPKLGSRVAEWDKKAREGWPVIVIAYPAPTMKTPHQSHSDLLTKQEVARSLKICVRSVENLMAARRLAFIRIGRAVRFERSEIDRFKASLTVQAVA